ncbi:MAG: hypothetical protein UT82_C0011G0023 [Parcubacteria group bacterium GW2011_GWB1_40_14]|nr:MAG: hypothetical protein UT82_C0011G0023 [Parcubacteria group bacterium GW2011_GWB1_40_14]
MPGSENSTVSQKRNKITRYSQALNKSAILMENFIYFN